MKKILITGASGLIGHTLMRELSPFFQVTGTLHGSINSYKSDFFRQYEFIENVDVLNREALKGILMGLKPDVVLNCTGVTRRKIHAGNVAGAIEVNAVFPHWLAGQAAALGARMIHFSTDCVFDGKKGPYTETDLTTAEDIYGRTKALGEVTGAPGCLTLRSSFIGMELRDKTELLEWFLARNGETIKGFRRTFYSGVSTLFMTRAVKEIILNYPGLHGLWQLSPEIPVSKYDLLMLAREKFGVDVQIIPDDDQVHTPTLDGSKLRLATGIRVPSWDEMMEELAACQKKHYQ